MFILDWNSTDYGRDPAIDDAARLLPLVIDSFSPKYISLIGKKPHADDVCHCRLSYWIDIEM